ncbi:NAD(P)-binding protein [Viridothelium virens]|uniref:NAD(P)-binding protein n=1 Tax=Viridothelium virens TaxID=1048519 RepID=A0A6A6GXK5_VIRVR|nr:NAD(P)-binding protein [Viridothelium virens]
MAGKVCVEGITLVTGAAQGIGREVAISFAKAGARGVIFADINEDGAQEAAGQSQKYAKQSEYRGLSVKVDITSEESVASLVSIAVKEFGRIDYAVHSAGIEQFEKAMITNIQGTMLCYQEPLWYESRHSKKSLGRGSIINLGSVNSYCAAPGMMPYTSSKHAVIGITKTAAIDNFKAHIRVNAVCPAWVDTPMMQASLQRFPQLGPMIKVASPLGRAATVEEVADYIVFLSSPSASFINGTGLIVDAGLKLTVYTP